ncbi:unnamed protein product, partial [Porites evermanni]
HRDRPALSQIHVCDDRVLASPTGGNVGVLLNKSLSMPGSSRVTAMSTDPLRKIRLIRKHLIFDAAQLLVQALENDSLKDEITALKQNLEELQQSIKRQDPQVTSNGGEQPTHLITDADSLSTLEFYGKLYDDLRAESVNSLKQL